MQLIRASIDNMVWDFLNFSVGMAVRGPKTIPNLSIYRDLLVIYVSSKISNNSNNTD